MAVELSSNSSYSGSRRMYPVAPFLPGRGRQVLALADIHFSLWLFFAMLAFVRDIGQTHFNLNHWSAAYPLGVYGVACSQLTIDLDSRAFAVVTTIVSIALFCYWVTLVIYTIPSIVSGELFLAEVVEKREEEAKHRESRDGLMQNGEGEEGGSRA